MKLSIITINFNNKAGLERTCRSIANQSFKNFEWIIIDGGSTDGSIEIIEKYVDYISFWVSEPDKGIYNAMNKGVYHANGEYCLHVNSGDYLYNNNVIAEFHSKKEHCNEDFIIGGIVFERPDGSRWTRKRHQTITANTFFVDALPHPSTFIRTDILKAHPYREDYRIVSDWIFMMEQIIVNRSSYCFIESTISVFIEDGISSKNLELCTEERERGFKEVFGEAIYKDYADFFSYRHRKLTKLERILSRLKNYPFFYYMLTFFGIFVDLLSKPYKLLEKIFK